MKFPWSSGGNPDTPKIDPEAGLPKVDPWHVAKEQKEAEIAKAQAERRADRQKQSGPAARMYPDYPKEPLKTEGLKPGTEPPQGEEKKPSKHDLTTPIEPKPGPDVAKPGVIYTMQPGGGVKATQAPPQKSTWEQLTASAPTKPDLGTPQREKAPSLQKSTWEQLTAPAPTKPDLGTPGDTTTTRGR